MVENSFIVPLPTVRGKPKRGVRIRQLLAPRSLWTHLTAERPRALFPVLPSTRSGISA